jgi:hypothetical protein
MKYSRSSKVITLSLLVLYGSMIFSPRAFAQAASSGGVTQVESFIRSLIQAIAGLAGLVATGFFVVGGFGYITSSGNPEHLDRSKRTLLYSAIGLAITIGAFVLSNIISEIAAKAFGN